MTGGGIIILSPAGLVLDRFVKIRRVL